MKVQCADVSSASPCAAAPGLHRKPCKPGHVHRARIEVGTLRGRRRLCHRGHAAAFVPGACGAAAWQASDSRRGRMLGCAQGTTCVGYQARRDAEGGLDGGWRLRVAAVAYCEADDRVVNSASPRAAAPRSLDETLECYRLPTSKSRRSPAVSTGAQCWLADEWWGSPARRRSGGGRVGGWGLRVAAVPAAGQLIVSSATLRCARPRRASIGNPASPPGHAPGAHRSWQAAGSPPSVPSWVRCGLRARSVRCGSVAGLRLAAGTNAGLRAGHDVCGVPGSA